jgi:hypothetical protein
MNRNQWELSAKEIPFKEIPANHHCFDGYSDFETLHEFVDGSFFIEVSPNSYSCLIDREELESGSYSEMVEFLWSNHAIWNCEPERARALADAELAAMAPEQYKEEKLHALARAFMDCFPDLEPESLDEFLLRNSERLTETEKRLGQLIVEAVMESSK